LFSCFFFLSSVCLSVCVVVCLFTCCLMANKDIYNFAKCRPIFNGRFSHSVSCSTWTRWIPFVRELNNAYIARWVFFNNCFERLSLARQLASFSSHEPSFFSNAAISKCSAATRLSLGKILTFTSLQTCYWVCEWKNFENQLTFGEFTRKSTSAPFLTHHVHSWKTSRTITLPVTVTPDNGHYTNLTGFRRKT